MTQILFCHFEVQHNNTRRLYDSVDMSENYVDFSDNDVDLSDI